MFKYLLVSFTGVLLIGSVSVYSQKNANVGIFAGTAYYMGDINPNRHFYRPSLSLGAFYRYNINTRFAVRANAYYAQLSGNDLDFPESTASRQARKSCFIHYFPARSGIAG